MRRLLGLVAVTFAMMVGAATSVSAQTAAGPSAVSTDPSASAVAPQVSAAPSKAATSVTPAEAAMPTAQPAVSSPQAAPANVAPVTGNPLNPRYDPKQTADVIRTTLILTLLAILPAIAICMTPFIRIVVVLSMIRHAFGMPETPPNQMLTSLALFLTLFVMMPTITVINTNALQPFLKDAIPLQEAMKQGADPMRKFMLAQVHDQDIKTVYEIAKKPLPAHAADVGLMEVTTAFMLNELRVSFKIGFVIMLPFLLIDLVVASILLGLGMMMVPPSTISLPIKVLMFVLIDGWSLVLQGVVGSFR